MYARSKVAARIALAESYTGFPLVEHSIDEVDAFEAHLRASGKYTYNDQGIPNGTRDLTSYESQWMLNEQTMVQCSADYFLTRYCYVKDEENIIRRFVPRIPQLLLLDIIRDLEERDSSIEIQCLKARQLGLSTIVELLISQRIILSHGVNAVIGSADQTKTGLMANMLFLCYDMLPVWIRPEQTRRVESDRGMLVFGSLASGVSFQHGAQASGIARGTTPTIYHLSECASFTDPVNQIEASLFKAVHASPNVFGVLESTGEGDKGWWPDTWRHAKANWSKGRARLCPLFLPWFCGTDIYPTPTWLRMRPIPDAWRPNRDTRLHVAKAELYVRSEPLLSRHLGFGYRMPREQQWFWEVEHEQAKAKNIEGVFLQEMAGDDEEALQRSSESVFGHDTISIIDNNRERDYLVYGLAGQSIEDRHEPPPEDIDYSRERIPVRFDGKEQGQPRRFLWELIPLRFSSPLSESDPEDANGKLFIWHAPRPRVNYSIGVDTSEGKGQDSTVISVWAIGNRNEPDVQCAEFASNYVNHVEAYAFVMVIAAYFGQYMAVGETRWPWPYLSVEQVQSVGDTCQLQCMKMGYPVASVHKFTRLDAAPSRIRKQKHTPTKLGWYTYGWSRPILVGNFVHFSQSGWLVVNSPWMIEEMKQFEVHVTASGKERMEHSDDSNDDRIFSSAMATFCPADTASLSARSQKRSLEPVALPPIDLGDYRPNVFSAGQLREKTVSSIEDLVYSDTRLERYQ